MARLSPTPVFGGYRSAGSFTQLQAALSNTSRVSAWTIQPAPLRPCYSDPDIRSLAIMVASAATTPAAIFSRWRLSLICASFVVNAS
jgi:hypothetical protein